MRVVKKHRHIRLESLRYNRNRPNADLSKTKYYPRSQANETKSKAFPLESPSNYSNRGGESSKSKFYQKGKVPRMAGQCCSASKERR